MTPASVVRRRLASQQLTAPRFTAAADLVRWMGAVQSQDAKGGAWAIGLRLRGGTERAVEEAILSRAIARTWPMRGTLHFVPAEDARWMVRLLAPRMMARAAGRHRALELDGPTFTRARRVLERALSGGRALTRPAAYAALDRAGVSPAGQRGIHVIGQLAQQGVLCFGPRDGKQATFVLLEDWIRKSADPSREEALALLATRYFAGRGPATVQDFAWWTGLLMKDAQEAMRLVSGSLVQATPTLWSAGGVHGTPRAQGAVLLPAWDEYLVGYADRADAFARIDPKRTRFGAGIGASLVVVDGRVVGSWRRTLRNSSARLTVDYWTGVTAVERRAIRAAAARYGRFLDTDVELRAG